VLFFANEPRKLILQCQMTLIAFKGTGRVNIYDRKEVQDDLRIAAVDAWQKAALNPEIIKSVCRAKYAERKD
jgi:predicted HTH transcriptional regulator